MKPTKRKAPPPKPVVTIELAKGVPMEFRLIPPPGHTEVTEPGAPLSFMMGSRGGDRDEEPRHLVMIPQPFYLGTFPVTQREFMVWTGSSAYRQWHSENNRKLSNSRRLHQNGFPGDESRPAENLSWYEARGFIDWFNSSKLLSPHLKNYSASLPFEAEWEFACRASTETAYWTGETCEQMEKNGWFQDSARGTTQSVKSSLKKTTNHWGLKDMNGNVWEWCEDYYDPNAYAKREHPFVPSERRKVDVDKCGARSLIELHRVLRGGSWQNRADWGRSAQRYHEKPGYRSWSVGFRVLLRSTHPSHAARASSEPAAPRIKSNRRMPPSP